MLRLIDRAADARVRVYGHELDHVLAAARAMGLSSIPLDALEPIVARMLDQEPPEPTSLDAWRASR